MTTLAENLITLIAGMLIVAIIYWMLKERDGE